MNRANTGGERMTNPHGYLMLFPHYLREGVTVEPRIFSLPPAGGPPAAAAMKGRDEIGRPWLGITYDAPFSWLRLSKRIDQQSMERFHISRFAVDHRLATRTELFELIEPGDEPPDFYATTAGKRVGWELTQFVVGKRRAAQSLFFEVTNRLVAQHRHRIGHLSGYQVVMWFGTADDPTGLPFTPNNQSAYDAVVDALIKHVPDPQQFAMPVDQAPPQQLSANPFVRSPGDVTFYTVPLLGGAPASGLFAMTGIAVGLAFQSDHTAPDEWANLRQQIRRKDKANDRLLITVGAPDQMGRCFASEELLAHFLLDYPEAISATHLTSVVMHFWSTGQAVELLGEAPSMLCPSLYQGFSSGSHPFAPQPVDPSR